MCATHVYAECRLLQPHMSLCGELLPFGFSSYVYGLIVERLFWQHVHCRSYGSSVAVDYAQGSGELFAHDVLTVSDGGESEAYLL